MTAIADGARIVACHFCGWEGVEYEVLGGPGAAQCPSCGLQELMTAQ